MLSVTELEFKVGTQNLSVYPDPQLGKAIIITVLKLLDSCPIKSNNSKRFLKLSGIDTLPVSQRLRRYS